MAGIRVVSTCGGVGAAGLRGHNDSDKDTWLFMLHISKPLGVWGCGCVCSALDLLFLEET